ncbi:MAG: glycosyltransferase [Clostridia bacterium]|nr:glycosyltransferase [Clostridia bacterium]
MKISVIIPMYNEAKIIENSAKTLSAYCEKNLEDFEILFVDDGSRDGCGEIVEKLGLSNVSVVSYGANRGKGCAVRTGMLKATGDLRIFTDADLAYGTDGIGEAVKLYKANSDADLIIGSRKLAGDGYGEYTLIRKLASKAYLTLLQIMGGFKLSDSQVGFKCFSADAAKRIFSLCETDRFAFDFEALCYASRFKMKIMEMPVRIINHGESKINVLRDSVKMFGDIIKIRARVKKKMAQAKKNA